MSDRLRNLPSVQELAGRLEAPHGLAAAAARAAIAARRDELREGIPADGDDLQDPNRGVGAEREVPHAAALHMP